MGRGKTVWMTVITIVSLLLPYMMVPIDGANAAENPNWKTWLEENAHPIKKLEATKEDDFSDLSFLDQVLKDKRIVMLGESSHGAKQFNSAKVRLIQYLHQKQGYEVVAFESGLAETQAANTQLATSSSLEMMQNSLYRIWQTQENLPLFEYLKEQKKRDQSSIQLSGVDMQPTGSHGVFLKNWFQSIDPKMADKAFEVEKKFRESFGTSNIEQFQQDQKQMIQDYREIQRFVKKNQKKLAQVYPDDPNLLKVTHYILKDRIASTKDIVENFVYYFHYLEKGDEDKALHHFDKANVMRDQAMAKHLTWLAEKLYPNKKIIVWAHNIHIRKANTETENPVRSSVVTFGQLLPKKIKKESYVMGLYMNQGESALNDGSQAPVRYPHPKGNVESILEKEEHPNLFVDLSKQNNSEGTSWMFTRRNILDWGIWDEQLVPKEQYDGILFIDHVTMPNYIWNNTLQSQNRFSPFPSLMLNGK